ncbi:hypothetical protein XELAEV_18046884mg [Xenopus laevis]|uniref:Uncharacterized protein n=1 Tax=Xenopus laevis TaxID=8355 RepID=A0A974BU99_XENLA|nr:hypothetical protein XELAEV_18046884mg [Xenopus laevis]
MGTFGRGETPLETFNQKGRSTTVQHNGYCGAVTGKRTVGENIDASIKDGRMGLRQQLVQHPRGEVSGALIHGGFKGNNGRNEGNHYLTVTLASAWDISLGFVHILIENIIMGEMGKQGDYRQLRINTQKYILAFGRTAK